MLRLLLLILVAFISCKKPQREILQFAGPNGSVIEARAFKVNSITIGVTSEKKPIVFISVY